MQSNWSVAFRTIAQQLNLSSDKTFHRTMTRTTFENSFQENLVTKIIEKAKKHMYVLLCHLAPFILS